MGDARRTSRLVSIAGGALARPGGTVASVFDDERQRERAYEFLSNELVDPAEMLEGVWRSTLRRCGEEPYVFVPVDGTSISLTAREGEDEFGAVGTTSQGGRGLKLIDALAVEPSGTVIGWLDLRFWTRARASASPPKGTHARQARPVIEKETQYWIETIRAVCGRLDEYGRRGWFQIDREGDGRDLLLSLAGTTHWWTVRANVDRSIELEGGDVGKLRAALAAEAPSGSYSLPVSARYKRAKRDAKMVVRVAMVTLRLRDQVTSRIMPMRVRAVWAREEGTTPAGEEPIDWLLYTNRPVETLADAQLVIYGYSQRWRVEECHRTWKSGGSDIEATRLGSAKAVQRWAIILAAVAARIERIKRLARARSDAPASIELGPFELEALVMLRFERRPKERARAPKDIGEAVAWIAEMGGYANKYSGKPPGAVVIGRGLERLQPAARVLAMQARGR